MLIQPIHKVIKFYCQEKSLDLQKSKVLDVGCGSGDSVKQLLDTGIDAYGCDISFKTGENRDLLFYKNKIFYMYLDKNQVYRIPFTDNSFDIVYADQVIEHVEDIKGFISEVFRVLKPSGYFVGYFPSKNKFIEPHVGIPLGGILSTRLYIRFCVLLSLYYKKYKDSNNTVGNIKRYIDNKTFYRNKAEISYLFANYFSQVTYREDLLLDSVNKKQAYLLKKIPLGKTIYGTLWSHLLIAEK